MGWSSMKRNLSISFVILLLSVSCAWTQTGTTSVRGTVSDKTSASAGDAKVALDHASQAFHRDRQTLATGEHEFVSFQPCTCSVTIGKAGVHDYDQQHVHLLVDLAPR